MILTGVNSAMYFTDLRVGPCRSVKFDVSREALPTTKLGEYDKTYVYGLRDSRGSASLFYDPTDLGVAAIISRMYNDSASLDGLVLIFDTAAAIKLSANILVTNTSLSLNYGAAQACDIQFQVSGKPTEVPL